MVRTLLLTVFITLIVCQCKKDNNSNCTNPSDMIIGVDLSTYPEIVGDNGIYFNDQHEEINVLQFLHDKGINTVRLKLWHTPANEHASLTEVTTFSNELKEYGFKIWLDFHYSDDWADPAIQTLPSAWTVCDYELLLDSIYDYTHHVLSIINPDYVQVGNEINHGFIHPFGHINQLEQFKTLIDTACKAVRNYDHQIKIMLHYAGHEGSVHFFNHFQTVDYDMIGLSYYPKWHGKSLDSLEINMNRLHQTYGKDIVIAETAYPFTLGWNDQTHNVIGLEEQLILPDFPATAQGQYDFLEEIKQLTTNQHNGNFGFCYWGGEMIAWKGNQAQDGSSWENLALFDFQSKALPVIDVFCISQDD